MNDKLGAQTAKNAKWYKEICAYRIKPNKYTSYRSNKHTVPGKVAHGPWGRYQPVKVLREEYIQVLV